MADGSPHDADSVPVPPPRSYAASWLAWGWVALVVLAWISVFFSWTDLLLALDFQRLLRG